MKKHSLTKPDEVFTIQNMLESYLTQLNGLLVNDAPVTEIENLGQSPYIQDYEIAAAAFLQIAQKYGLNKKPLSLKQLPSGAVLLYENGFFPWGAFPYPRAHAELGSLLAGFTEYQEVCQKMALFQMATLDHHKKPVVSFFQQEQGCFFEELEQVNHDFFKALSIEPSETYEFIDNDLGIISKRDQNRTMILLASGCKTGMGAFLYKDVGVLNFAPQIGPIGDCSSFGLSSKAEKLEMSVINEKARISFRNRLAFFHPRKTELPWLSDSGFSNVWFSAKIQAQDLLMTASIEVESFRPLSDVFFSFFCKASSCVVAKSHKLNPRSLDRYLGPPQKVELRGTEGRMFLEPINGFSHMEIIPLAADGGFWGSDFMIAFSLKSPKIEFSLNAEL